MRRHLNTGMAAAGQDPVSLRTYKNVLLTVMAEENTLHLVNQVEGHNVCPLCKGLIIQRNLEVRLSKASPQLRGRFNKAC